VIVVDTVKVEGTASAAVATVAKRAAPATRAVLVLVRLRSIMARLSAIVGKNNVRNEDLGASGG
jgi:hypothetical protein